VKENLIPVAKQDVQQIFTDVSKIPIFTVSIIQRMKYKDSDSSGVAKGGGPPLAALLWGRHYGLFCWL